jgi:benzoate-CoA ligase
MLPGYGDPRSWMPDGKYPEEWQPFERIHPPEWRRYECGEAPEWLNPTELLLDRHILVRHIKESSSGAKTAVISDDVAYTYEDLLTKVSQVANALSLELRLDYDNRILIISPDHIDAAATWLAAHRCGVVPCWVSPLYKPYELQYFVQDLACKALFVDETVVPKIKEVLAQLPGTLKHIVVFRGDGEAVGGRSHHALVESMPGEFKPLQRHIDDFSYMFYSGGTTGRPKGVVHTVRDFTWVPKAFVDFMEWKSSYRHYDTSPKFHTHGLWPGLLIPLWNGGTSILRSDKLTPDAVVEVIEKHRPDVLTTVPPVLKWLAEYPSEKGRVPDLSSLQVVHTAAEKVPMVIHERFKALYGIEIYDSIGSSEVAYEWLANNPREHRMGTCGKPIFGCEAMLVDPHTSEIVREPHRNGEMWVKSKSVVFFYWRKYDKSKECLAGPWMRTGDLMYFDEDGYFWHVGRIDDVFKVSGMWVSPLEVEGALLRHSAVRDAAVVPQAEEATDLVFPKAFVVLTADCVLTESLMRELQDIVRKEIGGYKVPKWFEQIAEIPRTALNKTSRVTLRIQEK